MSSAKVQLQRAVEAEVEAPAAPGRRLGIDRALF